MINSSSVNLMREFSTACREEEPPVMNAPPPDQIRLVIIGATEWSAGTFLYA
jgi:hypothetical protein